MKSSNKSKLSVKAVKRYNKAKYPSWQDPNPIDHPETLPYPFKAKLLNSFLGIGLAGSMLFSQNEEKDALVQKEPIEMQKDSLQNPFPMEYAGVPYMPASFGTGLPSRLRREEAISTINKVFAEEGIDLKNDVQFDKDSLQFTANGYNEELKVGYLWMEYQNFGKGMMMRQPYSRFYIENQITDDWFENGYETHTKYLDSQLKEYKSFRRKNETHTKVFADFLENDFQNLSGKKQKDKFYHQYLIYKVNDKLSSEKHLLDSMTVKLAQKNLEKNDHQNLIKTYEVLSTYVTFARQRDNYSTEKIQQEISNFLKQDKNKWDKERKVYSEMIESYFHNIRHNKKDETFQILMNNLFNSDKKDRSETKERLTQYIDLIQIDFSEANAIEQAANQKEYFIAPISQRDNRFIYQHNRVQSDANQAIMFKRYIENAKTEEKKARFQKLLDELGPEPYSEEEKKPQDKALKRLEEQVRNYIIWSKTQQGY